jgi:cytochrome c oxidase assembly protein subunit 15
MQVESAPQALPRRRTLAVSPEGFRRAALVASVALVLIVATGATVRLTGSGLGCPHWPGCEAREVLPKGYHSTVEFSNRVVAFLTVLATLVLAIAAWVTTGLRRWVKVLATLVFVGTLGQAPLGALTVHYHLNPWLVISHLLLSLLVLGLGVFVLLEATRLLRGGATALPRPARAAGSALMLASAVLVFSGTLATAAGRYPGSSGDTRVRRLGSFEPSVAFHVRAVAAFGIVFLVLAAWAWRNRERFPWLVRGCGALLAILLVQMAIGEVQYRTYHDVPWWLVLIHVTVAACVFAWTVGVVARVWRPLADGPEPVRPPAVHAARRAQA